jgi:MFS family permease
MPTRTLPLPPFLAPFVAQGFAGLWISASSGSFARIVIQLVLSWLMLETTGSPFLVGVVSAARSVPQLLLGIPAGALADWADRRAMVIAVNTASVALLLTLVPMVAVGFMPPVALVAVSALFGTLDTLRMAATQAYAYDLVRTSRATSGMALTNLGVQLLTMLGGLVGGYVLDHHGTVATFGIIGLALAAAVLGPLLSAKAPTRGLPVPVAEGKGPFRKQGERHTPQEATGLAPKRTRPDLRRAAATLVHNRMVATVAVGVILAEILGFATQTLLPTFAHDVFDVGASGLGTMFAVRSGGGALGLLLLAWIGAESRAGQLFVVAATLLGATLAMFGLAPEYLLALMFLALSGLCASVMDTLGQTLMQHHAGEQDRGAAMGAWVFSVGFGPFGHLALGGAATIYGAPMTQVVAGSLLVGIGLLLALNRSLRQAR